VGKGKKLVVLLLTPDQMPIELSARVMFEVSVHRESGLDGITKGFQLLGASGLAV